MKSTDYAGTEDAGSPPESSAVISTLHRLRAEHEVAELPARQAVLLHEIAVLEEATGDEAAAARDQLAAVNVEPEFTEPLERLIAIIERRQSYRNLGKLLERLSQVALTTQERTRALVDQAFYLLDHEEDVAGALSLVEQATEANPNDPTPFLALELLAIRADDGTLRDKALARRASLTAVPAWQALLLNDLAELRAAAGDADGALSALEQALAVDSVAKFSTLLRGERLAQKLDDASLEARCLEGQASLLKAAASDASAADSNGVPKARRTSAHAADAWLRAAEAYRRAGDDEQAKTLLDRALAELPGDPSLTHARISLAEARGESGTVATLAKEQLERGTKGELAAALWLKVAEAAASDADPKAALAAVESALAEDPKSIPARALELDLRASASDGAALASALEAAAERVASDRARAGFYFAAADAWTRLAKDAQGARAALSQAAASGASPAAVARVGRLLASSSDDTVWLEESTRRLILQGASAEQAASLWFELGRARALRGEREAAAQAFSAIAEAPGGGWLGSALGAYALDLLPATDTPESEAKADENDGSAEPDRGQRSWRALLALAREESEPDVSRAARLAAAERALAWDDRKGAGDILATLHKEDDADPIVATALAALEASQGKPEQAAGALLACAAGQDDSELAAALRIEAGLLSWRADLRTQALDAIERAQESAPDAAGVLFAWALRAAQPDDLSARRRALENAGTSASEVEALERFTLELAGGEPSAAARAALEGNPDARIGSGLARLLARALWDGTNPDERERALDAVADRSPPATALARGAAFEIELTRSDTLPDRGALEAAAARWAEADTGAAPALEWLAAAIAHGDAASEVAARRALSERLPGTAGRALDASASLIAWLTGLEEPPALVAEDDASTLVNVELAPPGSDPRRRGLSLIKAGDALGDDSLPVTRAMAGYNLLAASDPEAALAVFRGVVEALPDEVIGWEGLRAAAETLGKREIVAEACAALGDAVKDPSHGGQLWEEAATLLFDELGDRERGELALARAVERDVRRAAAFDRLFRIVRERKDNPRLLELITRRLEVAEDPEEIVKLFWERARVLRSSGDREGALAALENVRMLEADHVGALALSGEIHLTMQRFPDAAEQLGRLSGLAAAPAQQRLMSGVAAVDIFENKLGDPRAALGVLEGLFEASLATAPVKERLARVAAKAEAWPRAAQAFELLMNERDTSAGRAEAARLALAIRRDRLGDTTSARDALARLLDEQPDDGEALDLLLAGHFDLAFTRPLLERGRDALELSLAEEPTDLERVERLSRVAKGLGDARLRQATLGALAALGVDPEALDIELAELDRRVARVPSIAIDEASLPELADPEDGGPIATLMRLLGTTIAEAIGPNLAVLGVTKKERLDPRSGDPTRNEVLAWAGALGIGEIEVYVGGKNPNGIYGVATEPPSLVLGPAMSAPFTPIARQAVARELFALTRGTTVLAHREPTDVAALIVAACKLGGVDVDTTPYAMLGEFQRLLGKEIPRRVRKALPEIAAAIAHAREDPARFHRAATASLDRMAAIAAGDVSWVLCGDARNRGRPAASVEGQERARRLLSFVLSPSYLALRDKLGMGVR